MKKVININFQGRVIPIEETAYDILKQYIESLRIHFAGEEGRDEIINDIEGRIAELFNDNLKKGATCITDEDVNTVIASIGRPEDFEDGDNTQAQSAAQGQNTNRENTYQDAGYREREPHRRLYRDENDKMLGGVCSGLAAYLRIDPTLVRIVFTIITFGSFGTCLLVYILLWAILPSTRLEKANFRKRLFRNPDEKVIAGVASGIAAYFDIAVWIPRLIFASPLAIGIIVSILRKIFGDYDPGPSIVFGSLGSSLSVIYVILWVVIPEAHSTSEKLEMRGEKVDLNSIKNSIQEDLGQFKNRTEKWGAEISQKATEWSKEFTETVTEKGKQFGTEVGAAASRGSRGIGNAIGILFKAFFLFIAGVFAFAMLMILVGAVVGGVSYLPVKNFFLDGFWQNALAWATLVLFFTVPVIGLVIWVVRRVMRVKSKNSYLSYTFSGLWVIGLICAICLAASITRSYSSQIGVGDKIDLVQPSKNKLVLNVSSEHSDYLKNWSVVKFGIDWDDDDDAPFYTLSEDSVVLRTVRVKVVKSEDTLFHTQLVKFSHGSSAQEAKNNAGKIQFPVQQADSLLTLPPGFALTSNMKFHNQQVLLIVGVPVGKKIQLDGRIKDYKWFNIEFRNRRHKGWNVDWDDNWDNGYDWQENVEYVMTDNGLKATKVRPSADSEEEMRKLDEQKKDIDQRQQELKDKIKRDTSNRYHYKPEASAALKGKTDIVPGPAGLLMTRLSF
ncbi:PspC domain-containing protein [Deminuibacter soli]|uniref:PspC domain-containing protein n=1 Tax=Deminuibacter soli TaxID=2291815 RepID=A0A3E1NQR0_9BACT|nr:PspC domain-containing protein [Deminuibacter soli]RFM30266.1 PspC domain-containing protein [Deminuibacter soli]